jgi:hypothetical protein
MSVCTHEATEFSANVEEFWSNGESYAKGVDIYGNSDSANIYVLPSMLAERPLTRVVWIDRDLNQVARSMKNAGIPCEERGIRSIKFMHDANQRYFDLVVRYDALVHPQVCNIIWQFCLPGVPWDMARWMEFTGKRICYSKENPMPHKSFNKFLGWVQRDIDDARKEQMR